MDNKQDHPQSSGKAVESIQLYSSDAITELMKQLRLAALETQQCRKESDLTQKSNKKGE